MEFARRPGFAIAVSLALLALSLVGLPLLTGQLGALAALRAAAGFLLVLGLPGYALAVAVGLPADRGLRLALAPALGAVAAMVVHTVACALLADRLEPLMLLPALPLLSAFYLWRRRAALGPGPALVGVLPALVVLCLQVLLVSASLYGFGAETAEGFAFPGCGAHGTFGQYQMRLRLLVLFDQQTLLPAPALSGLTMPYYHLFPAAFDSLLYRSSGATALTVLAELRPVYSLVVLVPAAWALLRALGLGAWAAALGCALVSIGTEGLPFILHTAYPHVALAMGVFAAMLTLVTLERATAPRALLLSAVLLGALAQIRPSFFLCGGGGLAVVAVVDWLHHRRLRLVGLGAGAFTFGLGCAGIQLLRTQYYGDGPHLRLAPLEAARSLLSDAPEAIPGVLETLGLGLIILLVALNLRLVGLGLWAFQRRGVRLLVEWWLLAAAAVALLGATILSASATPVFLAMVPDVGLGCLAFVAARGLFAAFERRRRLVQAVVLLGGLGAALGVGLVSKTTVECAVEEKIVMPYPLAGGLAWIREHSAPSAVMLAPVADLGSGLLAERIPVAWLPPENDVAQASLLGMGFLQDESLARQAAIEEFYRTSDPRRAAEILAQRCSTSARWR